MRTKIALITSLAALGAMLPGAAWAQDAAAPPAAAPAPPTAAPAAATPAAETPAAPMGAPPAAEPPAAAPAGPTPLPGWVRIDSDFGGVQLWGGATFPLADGIGLAFDMYVFQGLASLGEFDIGPAITAGPFTLTPMIGAQIDWTNRHAQALVPQFYVTGGPSPIYAELWFQYYNNRIFNKDTDTLHVTNQVNGRLIVDYKISDYVGLGPELDLGFDSGGFPNANGDLKKVYSLPVGLNLLFTNVGLNSTFMGFLGYETGDPTALKNHVGGRLTFVHNF